MHISQLINTKDIDTKMKEASVYCSMGLFQESLDIYEHLLSGLGKHLTKDKRKQIEEEVRCLKKEIEDYENMPSIEPIPKVSKENISIIKEAFSSTEYVQPLLENASSFKELGLYSEAINEYEKLLKLDYPAIEIIPGLTECYLHTSSPPEVLENTEKIIAESPVSDQEKAEIKFRIGQEMEKRDRKELAVDLYKSAMEIYPENPEFKNKLNLMVTSLSTGSKYDYLLNQQMVSTKQLQKALVLSKKMKKSVEFILVEHFKINKDELGKSLSFFYGCPFKDYDFRMQTPVELINTLKRSFLLQDIWVPLSWGKDGIDILIENPRDLIKTDQINGLFNTKKINLSVGIREDIEAFIRHFFDEKRGKELESVEESVQDFDIIPDFSFEEEEELADEEDELDEASGQVVRLIDQTLVAAYRKNVSDIHIEPSSLTKKTSIRFRIDGVCQEYLQTPNSMARGVLSRIKIMSGLDIAERRLPQDGKIKFRRKGVEPFELRVATLPTTGGFEDAVLRILPKSGAMKLDDMGLNKRNLKIMKEIIAQPYGLVLVVGPTGSGKTTTLHAVLGYINKPGIKIWTAEDPVEITQQGLRQVEAKPKIGLDFARIMRAFLRADPDVIMIGEMRDYETASIGVEASLTGHLVFSTLHTNSAPDTITRLLEMGLNPLNFSDAFLGVLAQRLVRRLCTHCKAKYHPSEDEFEEIVKDYGQEYFQETGIEYTPELTLFRAKGCAECSNTGYRGRIGIHELLEGTAEIKRMIKKETSSEELFVQGINDGMTTLKQDGILKVFQGLTDINEVRRVCVV